MIVVTKMNNRNLDGLSLDRLSFFAVFNHVHMMSWFDVPMAFVKALTKDFRTSDDRQCNEQRKSDGCAGRYVSFTARWPGIIKRRRTNVFNVVHHSCNTINADRSSSATRSRSASAVITAADHPRRRQQNLTHKTCWWYRLDAGKSLRRNCTTWLTVSVSMRDITMRILWYVASAAMLACIHWT